MSEQSQQASNQPPVSTTTDQGIRSQKVTHKRSSGRLWLSLRSSPIGITGAIIVIVVLLVAIFGPAITPHDPVAHNLRSRFAPPGYVDDRGVYLLGTDQLGRDVLSRIIIGTRVSVFIGVVSVLIAGLVGVVYGLIAGYFGGWVDEILMRFADAFLAIPFIVLVVAAAGVLGPGLFTITLILGLTRWVIYARIARGETLAVRELEYVTAARAIGSTNLRIMALHVLPNIAASLLVIATLMVATTVLAESALSFLGLGVQPPTVTWGLMLSDGRQYIGSAWWMTTFPGIAITITVLGVVFLGDWLRDYRDPRLRDY